MVIKGRMEYELMDKYGEFIVEGSEEKQKKFTPLQIAFECLAFRYALTKLQNGKLDSEDDKTCWSTISKVLSLSPACARLLFTIVYQCPKEFRIAHLSQASQAAYMKQLKILKDRGFIYDGQDFYGDYYEISAGLMRAIAFGEDWHNPKKLEPPVSNPFEDLFDDTPL